MRKTFEILPVGAILQEGDFYPLIPHPGRIGTESIEGISWIRPIAPKRRETITHDGVEYDAEPAPIGCGGYLACRPDGLMGEPYKTTYHAPVIEEPDTPSETSVLALAADSWEDEARWIEWAKQELTRLREDLGESS